MLTKTFDLGFPGRFDYNVNDVEFRVDAGTPSARQFKTALGLNLLRSQLPDFVDDPTIPTRLLARLTDGNLDVPYQEAGANAFRWVLADDIDLKKIVVKFVVGTQPFDVVIATSQDGSTYDFHYSNDANDSLALGLQGTDPSFIATEEGLVVNLNCTRAKYVHFWCGGHISTGPAASSNQVLVRDIEAWECVYSDQKPEVLTLETVRLTDFFEIDIAANETDNGYLAWNPIVNGNKYFYNGVEWILAVETWHWNTTTELTNNLQTLFLIPTVYEVSFVWKFVSVTGEETAEILTLSVDYENVATTKASTTRVYGQTINANGMPRTDIYVTVDLEISGNSDTAVEGSGSRGRVVFAPQTQTHPTEADRVDTQGVFFKDVVPTTSLSGRTKYIFTFWQVNPKNAAKPTIITSVQAEVPKISKWNLPTQVLAV